MRTILPIALLALLAGAVAGFIAGRSMYPHERYTFQHRTDAIYRYDAVGGTVAVLRPNRYGWENVVSSGLDSSLKDNASP